jgi:hypothetical protein
MVCLKFIFNFSFEVAGLNTDTFSGLPREGPPGSTLTTIGLDRAMESLKRSSVGEKECDEWRRRRRK